MVSICFYDLVHDKLTMKHIFEQCVLMKKAVPVRILKYLCCFHQCYQRWVRPFELITIDIESQDCILFYFYMNIFPYVYRKLKVILMTQPQLRAATNLSPADLPPNIYWHPANFFHTDIAFLGQYTVHFQTQHLQQLFSWTNTNFLTITFITLHTFQKQHSTTNLFFKTTLPVSPPHLKQR